MTISDVMKRIILWGAGLAVVIALIGSVVGWLVAGATGVVSALIGCALAVVFTMLTAASILLAIKLSKGDMLSPAYFGVVLGGLALKFALFLGLILVLREQPWLHGPMTFGTLIVAVLGSLVIDCIVVATSRVPYVDEPADEETYGRPAKR